MKKMFFKRNILNKIRIYNSRKQPPSKCRTARKYTQLIFKTNEDSFKKLHSILMYNKHFRMQRVSSGIK